MKPKKTVINELLGGTGNSFDGFSLSKYPKTPSTQLNLNPDVDNNQPPNIRNQVLGLTTTTRTSQTLVPVGPVLSSPPVWAKK